MVSHLLSCGQGLVVAGPGEDIMGCMIASPSHVCPRCGRHNVSRARFCAQCGLNLAANGADEITQVVRRTGRKTGGGLVLFVILMGLFLAAMGSLFRHRACSIYPPMRRTVVAPVPEQGEPWTHGQPGKTEPEAPERWHTGWETER